MANRSKHPPERVSAKGTDDLMPSSDRVDVRRTDDLMPSPDRVDIRRTDDLMPSPDRVDKVSRSQLETDHLRPWTDMESHLKTESFSIPSRPNTTPSRPGTVLKPTSRSDDRDSS